jgi:3-hydroxyisobutyrate dehydrogenase-like beta-hydroxyacid dehydrogenase
MGTPMVRNLLKAGYQLTVYDRAAEKAERLVELGAKVASSPADVAKQCEVVITMLPADLAVKEVATGPKGIAEGASAGLIVIDSSTVLPATSKQIAAELAKLQVEMLDAPVTGSEPQAVEGKLTFIVGGKDEIYEKCLPLFKAMGKASFHMGPHGAGSYTKLSNNTISAISLIAFTEGVVMATKAGINPQLFVEVISQGGARSGQIDTKAPKVLKRDFHPNFATSLMYKDLGLAGEIAKELNVPTPALAIAREMLNMAIAKGYGQEDVCSVVKCYEEWAHIEVRK